ncbi:MAG: nicotinate-nucleotide adenylyltransferase [Sphaerobacteraceae bacterium]|nr:MAG: nicotinate-nucleotide adenylyltransferase [Sphaerobacteraceae bacterium]
MRHGQRIGVFGGTFDPIHHGHLIIADELRYRLDLDCVLFLPAGRPPHKTDQDITADEHRLAMLRMAIDGDDYFDISMIDMENEGLSYTAESMREHQRRFPDATLTFLMGQDSYRDLPYWHKPGELVQHVRLGVALRPGVVVDSDYIEHRIPEVRGRVDLIDVPLIQIASSDIRRRVRQDEPLRYHVPVAVESYIRTHNLYRSMVQDDRF